MENPQMFSPMETGSVSENNQELSPLDTAIITEKNNINKCVNVFEQLCNDKNYAEHKREEKSDSSGVIGIKQISNIENEDISKILDKFNVESPVSDEDSKENEEDSGVNKENKSVSDENQENQPVENLLKNQENGDENNENEDAIGENKENDHLNSLLKSKNKGNEDQEKDGASDENKENVPVNNLLQLDGPDAVLQDAILKDNLNDKSNDNKENEALYDENKVNEPLDNQLNSENNGDEDKKNYGASDENKENVPVENLLQLDGPDAVLQDVILKDNLNDKSNDNKENYGASDENKENVPVENLLQLDGPDAVLQDAILKDNLNDKSNMNEQKTNMENTGCEVIISNDTDNNKFENENHTNEKIDLSKDEIALVSNDSIQNVDIKNTDQEISRDVNSVVSNSDQFEDASTCDIKGDTNTSTTISPDTSACLDLNESSNCDISNDFAVAEGSRLDTQYDVTNELSDNDSRPESNTSSSEGPQNELDKKEETLTGAIIDAETIPNNTASEMVEESGDVSDDDGDFDNDSLDGFQPETNIMTDSLDKDVLDDKETKEPQAPEPLIESFKLPFMSPALRGSVESLKSVTSVKSVQSLKNTESRTLSPKFKRRLRTFSSSSGKRDSGDFTIEIFESKRKPLESPITQNTPSQNEKVDTTSDNVGTCAKTDIESVDQCQNNDSDTQRSKPCDDAELLDNSHCEEPMVSNSESTNEGSENVISLDPVTDASDAPPVDEQHLQLTDTGRKNSDNTQKSPSEEVPSVQTKGTSGNVEQNVSDVRQATEEQVTKKATPMAFTIDLGTDTEEGSGDLANKKLDINASISKWAPKHRRNLSLSKVEENKKVEERGKPPVGRPRSGTLGSPLSSSGIQQPPQRRATGYHSEGYFSSDQDDEPRRIELNKPRSPRTPEAKSPMGPQRVMRSASQDSARGASLRMRSPSPDAGGRASAISNERATALSNELSMTMSLNESASRLLERMIANTPEPKRKLSNISGKSEGSSRQCCLGEKKPTVAELIGSYKSSKKDTKASEKMSPTGRKQSISAQSLSSCHTYDVNQEEDAVSEAGTYTIGNESPDVEAARSNIDNVFGVPATVSPAGAKTNNHAANQPWENSPENMSRASPNWIQQWAAQVAEQTKSPLGPATSPLGNKQPVTSPSPDSVGGRPRRKLPNVPTGQASASPQSSLTLNSPRASDFSDVESSNKALVDSTSSSAAVNSGLPGSPFASQDSGGDSDIDTLTSYPQTDNETRLSEAIRSKLKLSNLESTSKPKQLVSGLSRPEVNLQGRLKLGLRRERSTMSDVGYDSFAAVRQEQHCMQSDSSSETSENIKEVRKPAEKNPPLMKYNRAFSLRRARLDENTAAPVEKTKPTRASSATSVNGRSKAPLTASKSVQGDYSKHVSSKPQVNSPQGPVKDITREDGGRFSLRTTRSASTTNVSKSPPRKNLKKDLLRRAIPSRSNSTMSSKEAEFQNWKRRKNYDPRKAAAEGRKKQADKKVEEPSGETEEERTPSPQLLRSQSFHGTEGMVAGKKWPQKGNQYDHDEPSSATEDEAANIPQSSPLRRCDTSPHSLASPTHSTSPARQAQINAANAARRRKSYTLSDDGEGNNTSNSRKTSFDESESEGKSSPMGSTRGGGRAKVKMEALDNLVISTIHSLSVKVRTTSETLLQKLRSQYDEEGDRAALLEDVLAHLTESDQTLTPSQSRSTSRELAGILRNLKKIEHALEVVDRVLVYDDEEDDLDDEDLDGTVCNEWTEDY